MLYPFAGCIGSSFPIILESIGLHAPAAIIIWSAEKSLNSVCIFTISSDLISNPVTLVFSRISPPLDVTIFDNSFTNF